MTSFTTIVAPTSAWANNSGGAYVAALVGAAVGVAVVHLVVWVLRRRLLPRARRSDSRALRGLADALGAIRLRLLVPIAILIAAGFLSLPARVAFWVDLAAFTLIGLQVVLCLNRLIVTVVRQTVSPDPTQPTPVMLTIVTWALQLVVWLTLVLSLLAAGGVNITAFVASLGVGGIAVALALQNILGDLFASIAIGLDKPFAPGDYVAFDEGEGTVTHIGIKTTRIASLSGEELAIANSRLLAKLTHNYSRMPARRVALGFAVPYSTPSGKLSGIVDRVSEVISQAADIRFDRGHLTGFGTDGVTFEFVYYVLTDSFVVHRDRQQAIALQILGMLDEMGIAVAVPARTVTIVDRESEG